MRGSRRKGPGGGPKGDYTHRHRRTPETPVVTEVRKNESGKSIIRDEEVWVKIS